MLGLIGKKVGMTQVYDEQGAMTSRYSYQVRR